MSKTNELNTPTVDLERLKRDLGELSEIGRNAEDHGIYRMAFTEADLRGREWLECRMREAGLEVRVDGAANLIGRRPASGSRGAVVIGSHIDTVPCGGHLDGSLGVLAGLEVARVLKDRGDDLKHPVEVISFTDEEGRFGGMFGSEAFTGKITPETVLTSEDSHGIRLFDAMEQAGFTPMTALEAACDPLDIHAYLELHIEQGPVLDSLGASVGIVDDITGLLRWSAKLIGTPNHAGTTPMDMRHDAFLGLAEFANALPRVLEENGTRRSRATIGQVQIKPGAANTVPGQVDFSLDVRDTSAEVLEELALAFRKALSAIARRQGLKFEFEEVSRIEPTRCDPGLVDTFSDLAEASGISSHILPSGAAHDAQQIASIAPVGMLFAPSRDGQSHSPSEWTSWRDIEACSNLLLATVLSVAMGDRSA